LTISYGVPFQFDHATVQRAIDRVAAAVVKAGKWWGTTSGSPEAAQKALDRGARMVTCGADRVSRCAEFQNAAKVFCHLALVVGNQAA
jgi:2-keto-3-deoxy-L-rhamnonate aldolase RhmA